MVAVGLCAAQQRDRIGWVIPLNFVSVMESGDVAGATRIFMPSVEVLILLSVIAFSGLVMMKARCRQPIHFWLGLPRGYGASARHELFRRAPCN
jgi:hydrogenase/urease accessory protein HupE